MASRAKVQREYIIQGVVVERATQRGIRGVRVDTWDLDTRYHDLLGQAITDADGGFTVAFDSVYFGDYAPDRAPDVFFRVYRDDVEVLSTADRPMRNLQRGATTVRLELDVAQPAPAGRDRVSTEQALKIIDWWQASDFRGVARQARDKTTTVGKLFGALASDGIKNFDFKPVQPKSTPEREVVNQDQDTARRALAARQIQVTEVKSVTSLSSRSELRSIARYPLRLEAGDHVTLYEQDGVVKYYTRDPSPATTADEATIGRIDTDVQALKAHAQKVDGMRAEVANARAAAEEAATLVRDESEAARQQAEEMQRVRRELEEVRQASANKDVEIQKLQRDLAIVRTAQDNLATRVPVERLQALELAVQRLGGGRALPNPVVIERSLQPLAAKPAEDAVAKPAAKKAKAKKAAKKTPKKKPK